MSEHQTTKTTVTIITGFLGAGKTTLLKKYLRANQRNLILPANSFDPAWKSYPKLKPKRIKIIDPKDVNEKRLIWGRFLLGPLFMIRMRERASQQLVIELKHGTMPPHMLR